MDAQLRQQVAASPDLSLGRDWSEYDVWLRQQFPASPDLSCYPVRLWAQQPAAGGGPATSDVALGAVEAADTLSAAVALAVGVSLGAIEAADTAAFGLGLVDALALAGVEAADLFAGQVSAAVAPEPPTGGGYWRVERVKGRKVRDDRDLDRDVLRQMLEAAFADAPRDPVIVAAKREHPVSDAPGPAIPLVDWSGLLADLERCEAVLARYAERIAVGKTRTQRQEKAREELRYSEETVREAVAAIAEARRKHSRRRAALLLLLH